MYEKQNSDLRNFRAFPSNSIREKMNEKNDIRSPFQRDRDRILYSKAFRRLARKTQVFFSGHDDHIRTRLTHTLEVSQISRTIASFLRLDVDLTEAIALGHDIGHAPFGHVGERVINAFANGCESYKDFNSRASTKNSSGEAVTAYDFLENRFMGFKHNWQAVRIVEDLALHRKNEVGLGLTSQTVFGILFHTKTYWDECGERYGKFCKLRERGVRLECIDLKQCLGFYDKLYSNFIQIKHFTLEAAIVAIADEIAQRHHDLEDGLRFDLVNKAELLNMLLNNMMITDVDRNELLKCEGEDLINSLSSIVVGYYVMKSIDYIKKVIYDSRINNLTKFIEAYSDINQLQKLFDIKEACPDDVNVKSLLKHRVLFSYETQGMDGRADFMLRRLFRAYISNPQQLPNSTIRAFFKIYLIFSGSININDLVDKLQVKHTSIIVQTQIDSLSDGQLREILKSKHTRGRHVYKGCLLRAICDLISGMTDNKAQMEYKRLYSAEV